MEFATARCIFKAKCLSNTAPRKDLSLLKALWFLIGTVYWQINVSHINIIEVLIGRRKLSLTVSFAYVLLSAMVYGLIEATLVYQRNK